MQMQLLFSSLGDEFRVAGIWEALLYLDSKDSWVVSAGIMVQTGRKWRAQECLEASESQLKHKLFVFAVTSGQAKDKSGTAWWWTCSTRLHGYGGSIQCRMRTCWLTKTKKRSTHMHILFAMKARPRAKDHHCYHLQNQGQEQTYLPAETGKLLQSQPKPAMWLLTSASDLELDLERYRNFKEARQGTSISLLHEVAPIRAHSSLGGAHGGGKWKKEIHISGAGGALQEGRLEGMPQAYWSGGQRIHRLVTVEDLHATQHHRGWENVKERASCWLWIRRNVPCVSAAGTQARASSTQTGLSVYDVESHHWRYSRSCYCKCKKSSPQMLICQSVQTYQIAFVTC